MSVALTEYVDVAQVVLYVFWIFFFGLVYYLRLEDRREGYPLETDSPRRVGATNNWLIPRPKSFLLPSGEVVYQPDFKRDEREVAAARSKIAGAGTLEPVGDPMLANVGPGAWAARRDTPELDTHGHPILVPMRKLEDFRVNAGPDPRGFRVISADHDAPGKVVDLWVDRADTMVRYLEVELNDGSTRLVPLPMAMVYGERKEVEVSAVTGAQFKTAPTLKDPNVITTLEEEKVSAYFAGGRLYAMPSRLGPLV